MKSITDFDAVRLRLASPERILEWSFGEVTKPETINYRTQKPEKDGLFDERIFGPTKDWECYCGKYRRIRYKGIVCDKCGVEVTRSIVRRERMAHIKLASPVSHIWFLRGVPSKMGLLLDINVGQLEKVIYFASYIVTTVNEEAKQDVLVRMRREADAKQAAIAAGYRKLRDGATPKKKDALLRQEKEEADKLAAAVAAAEEKLSSLVPHTIISEVEYRDLSLKYGHVFKADIGSEAIRSIFEQMDLSALGAQLEKDMETASAAKRKRISRRLSLIRSLQRAGIEPAWMLLTVLPVIPPDLRPMVQLDGGRFAASDLNDLYRRVINRNNRLRRLLELGAPEVITRNEKRMLQEAVDALIDNSARRGSTTTLAAGQRRQLRSLADMLKGKQGRFRQNLLGKRVDYSGRSVIVVGPELALHQCGLPKLMALELFKPFVIHALIERELAHNIRSATRLIEQGIPEVWDALEDVTQRHKVLLNRAPTLHRLGIQAFQPVLIEGKAIQIHPMVTSPYNADFDGDQMAVHVPLSDAARYEASEIMLSSHNLLKPADGAPSTSATQDIVLGLYYITKIGKAAVGEGRAFSSADEARMAYALEHVAINARILVPVPVGGGGEMIETTVGRLIFNEIVPENFAFVNDVLDKPTLKRLVGTVLSTYGQEVCAAFLDRMKSLGFTYATKSGLSWGMADLVVPPQKEGILSAAQERVDTIRQQYENGLLTDEERYRMAVSVWEGVREEMNSLGASTLDPDGTVHTMVNSGARGSWTQVMQMMGMKGTVAGPTGEVVEVPIKSSFKEGFSALEYFLSTHGTRKGMADTALRTATAGYLTRRLVNVAQDLVVREEDCQDSEGAAVTRVDSEEAGTTLGKRIQGRVLAEAVRHPKTHAVVYKRGTLIGRAEAAAIDELEISEATIRSVVTCKAQRGICRVCYGWDLGRNALVDIGQPVGVVAAQSIGEPGTQLTMRTFHSGGVGGEDITQGLPRVEELFEARIPKGEALMSEIDGVAAVTTDARETVITITSKGSRLREYDVTGVTLAKGITSGEKAAEGDLLFVNVEGEDVTAPFNGMVTVKDGRLSIRGRGKDVREYRVPLNTTLNVKDGDDVLAGRQLTEGHLNLHSLFTAAGIRAVQHYILREVQQVYAIQGETINDKHLEIIVRQMLSRIRIHDAGDTELLAGRVVELSEFLSANRTAEADGKKPAVGERLLLGITKVSLTTKSFLAAASFMETARVLIDAAVTGQADTLEGLKENVIIGRLIPVGTGYQQQQEKLAARAAKEAASKKAEKSE
ncbi:MAG: DNA-directed RNA polymerase subunit beta' [Candidatus Andersenbacteria bacterium CG10_big_fil_rev_8_21_14_0_10_54_11]|uniref:DNA-directed RNA polymerase subunit beta' n=1 Tax=Candidatus Andersenbacteria bacterium CG10_big_fil_rev_8_21_14_0_10_54_11 TaxID=1974485 RepID=A0A2M6WZE5_9BACT|nr:MAG: DNA-directed RNA polymerase subunit beta' [Candidatus Andersenbacteria bacterium CG10_big_fil_rev_8_21_14_0_10_54_11]